MISFSLSRVAYEVDHSHALFYSNAIHNDEQYFVQAVSKRMFQIKMSEVNIFKSYTPEWLPFECLFLLDVCATSH